MELENNLKKRTWFYIQRPSVFEISSCSCGNQETQWSEYEKHVWCDKCEKDFIPEHNGVFDGPILMGCARLLGLHFSIINMETNKVEILDSHHQHMECQSIKDVIQTKEIKVNLRSTVDETVLVNVSFNYEKQQFMIPVSDGYKTVEFAIDYPNSNIFILSLNVKGGIVIIKEDQQFKDFNQFVFKSILEETLEEKEIKINKMKI